MTFKVLIVDDSVLYRRHVRNLLSQDKDLEVVGEAGNGREALAKVIALNPDVVTMDVEMPFMDGISATKMIMRQHPVPILMFSSLTRAGAQATLDALEAGALDYLPKSADDLHESRHASEDLLRLKVRLLARRRPYVLRMAQNQSSSASSSSSTPFMRSSSMLTGRTEVSVMPSTTSVRRSGKHYQCVAIGASTGGPVALQKVLTALPANFPVPILLVQHMPGTFTQAFAQRLDGHCNIRVKEAEQGDILTPGCAYLAPGGRQMLLETRHGQTRILIVDAPAEDNITYKPSVDLTFSSVSKVFGGKVLAIILTGMGADGREGCRELKQLGATIWAQDQLSCVVYGMPQAVASAGIAEKSMAIDDIGACILTEVGAA